MLKLNKLERFMWRHQRKILLICWILAVLPAIISNLLEYTLIFYFPFLMLVEATVITTAIYMIILSSRIRNFTRVYNYQFNMQAFLEGTNLLIETTNPKHKTQMSAACYNRIITLYIMGDYDRTEHEIKCFLQTFGHNNLTFTIRMYIKMAQIALIKENYEAYNEYIIKIQTLLESVTGLKLVKNALNYDYVNFVLFTDAMLCNKNINEAEYEAKVFEILNTSHLTGKPRKKEIMPIEYFSAYYKLFLFFKNRANTEKATFYANLLMRFGNAQLAAFREAKEYLENANRSN